MKYPLDSYLAHARECDMNSRRHMSALAAKTVEEVMGRTVCSCGYVDMVNAVRRFRNAAHIYAYVQDEEKRLELLGALLGIVPSPR